MHGLYNMCWPELVPINVVPPLVDSRGHLLPLVIELRILI